MSIRLAGLTRLGRIHALARAIHEAQSAQQKAIHAKFRATGGTALLNSPAVKQQVAMAAAKKAAAPKASPFHFGPEHHAMFPHDPEMGKIAEDWHGTMAKHLAAMPADQIKEWGYGSAHRHHARQRDPAAANHIQKIMEDWQNSATLPGARGAKHHLSAAIGSAGLITEPSPHHIDTQDRLDSERYAADPKFKHAVAALYGMHQAVLQHLGASGKQLELHRGVHDKQGTQLNAIARSEGGKEAHPEGLKNLTEAMSSWTSAKGVARGFAAGMKNQGAVLSRKFQPHELFMSHHIMPHSDDAYANEKEYVPLAPHKDKAWTGLTVHAV